MRLAVRACGICGSELHAVLEAQERRKPGIVMGHEFAGQVVEVGREVGRCAVGDRVAVQPLTHCGQCPLCQAGRTNACERRRLYGMTEGLPGGYAERAVVAEDRVVPIPDEVPFELATLGEPLAVALHAVGRGPTEGVSSVALVGCGTIGLMTLVALSTLEVERLFVVDQVAAKLALAEPLGATTLLAGKDDVAATVAQATEGRGVDVAIEAVGTSGTAALVVELARTGGHVTWIGTAQPLVEVNMQTVVAGEKTIAGSYGYTDADFRQALDLVAQGRVPAGWIAERRVSLESAPADLEALASGQWSCVKAVLVP
ncbi:MAG: zinc-dependent alcohol dehydrogenase [Candidatus Brocadiia bacterium]